MELEDSHGGRVPPRAGSPARKAPAAKAPARTAPPAKAPARKVPVPKAPVHKAPAAKAPGRKAPARKAAVNKAPAAKAPARKAPAAKAPAARPVAARTRTRPAAAVPAVPAPGPVRPATLAVDVGGTGLKASVLDAEGKLVADRVRVPTTYPLPPATLVDLLARLVEPLPAYQRVSVGFPGVVRAGKVRTAPHFVTRSGPGSPVVAKLLAAWTGFDLAGELASRLGAPTRVANDADLQGGAVVAGHGLEFVVTLGTGVGTAVFLDGRLAPHLELAHAPFRKGETYNEQLGEVALQRIGTKRWRRRVKLALENFSILLNYDVLYLGGGNSRRLAGHLDESVKIVDNVAGILGGIKLWESEAP